MIEALNCSGGRSHQCIRTSETGEHVRVTELKQDQTETQASARSLYNNWRLRKPLVVLIGKNYALFPYDLGDRSYVVLGWYMITQLWCAFWLIFRFRANPTRLTAEMELLPDGTGGKRVKVAMQWIPSQGQPWFAVNEGCDGAGVPSLPGPQLSGVTELCVPAPGENEKAVSRRKRYERTLSGGHG